MWHTEASEPCGFQPSTTQYRISVLTSLTAVWHRLGSFYKSFTQLRKCGQNCWACSSLMLAMGGHSSKKAMSPWSGGPQCYKQAGWGSQEGQVSNSPSPWMLHQLHHSRFLPWMTALTSLDGGQEAVRQQGLFPSRVAFCQYFIMTIET